MPTLDEVADALEVEIARRDLASIHQRMAGILGELPAIGKDAYNQQQSFHYRSHDDVLNALNPLLAKWGVFLVPHVLERTTSERKTRSGGTLYEVNLHVQYTFYGVGGDSIVASAWGEGTDSGDKSTNKAMTMAFKNVLAQAFAVSTADTIDADGHTDEETTGRTDGRAGRRFAPELEAIIEEVKALDPDPAHGGNHYYQVAINAAAKYHEKAIDDLAEGEMLDLIHRFRNFREQLLTERGDDGGLPVEETLVREGPAPVDRPTSWAEIEAAVRGYDDVTWEAFQEFLRQAKDHLWPDAERMSQQRKTTLFQKASSVLIKMLETHAPDLVPPPDRIEFQGWWSAVLDGAVLPGPEWSMSPDEAAAGRPARVPGGQSPPAPSSGEDVAAATTEDTSTSESPTAPAPHPPGADGEKAPSLEQTVTDTPLSAEEQAALDAVAEAFPTATEVPEQEGFKPEGQPVQTRDVPEGEAT